MTNRQIRKLGWAVVAVGCILIVLSKLWLGLALVALGLALVVAGGRCPHCGKIMVTVGPGVSVCPRCKRKL